MATTFDDNLDVVSRFLQPAPQSGPAVKVIYNSTNSEHPGRNNLHSAMMDPLIEPMRTPPPSPQFIELTNANTTVNSRQSQPGMSSYWPSQYNGSCLNVPEWDEVQVIDWVQSCIKKFNLSIFDVNLEKFKIPGCDLCRKQLADFVDYAGHRAGSVLHKALGQLLGEAINYQEKSDFNEGPCFDDPSGSGWASNLSVLPTEEPLGTLGGFLSNNSMIGIEDDINALDNASTTNDMDLIDYINSEEDDCSSGPTSPNSSVSLEVTDLMSANTSSQSSTALVSNELTKMFQFGKQPRKDSFNSEDESDSDDSLPVGAEHSKLQPRNVQTNYNYFAGKRVAPAVPAHSTGARPRGRPRKPKPEPTSDDEDWDGANRRKHNMKGNHLWEFIRDLLKNPSYNPRYIKWEDRETGVFRIVNSENIAKAWGKKKNNPSMTYEKLSRAMRYYYRRSILDRVDGRRLVYKFGKNASGWQ